MPDPAGLADLALHDATLVSLALDWAAGTCAAELRGPVWPGWAGVRVRWSGVRVVMAERREPWGPSVSVLEHRPGPGGRDELAMQSGDLVAVEAARCELQGVAAAPGQAGPSPGVA